MESPSGVSPHTTIMDNKVVERFFSKVDIRDDDDECWNWLCGKVSRGYAQFYFDGGRMLAHQFSYEYFHQEKIPDENIVRHNCHNPSCVNPRHLELGTHQDNMDDMVREGRQGKQSGIDHHNAFLTQEIADSIRDDYSTGEYTQTDLGYIYGVSQKHISDIVIGKYW